MTRTRILVAVIAAVLLCGVVAFTRSGERADPDGAAELTSAVAACPPGTERRGVCLEERFTAVVTAYNVGDVVAVLDGAGENDPEVAEACHNVLHAVGRKLGSARAPAEPVKAEIGTCREGLIHGYLTGVGEVVEPAELPSALAGSCDNRDGGALAECLHGFGHAAAAASRSTPAVAAELCGKLVEPSDEWRCVSGVVMEFANRGPTSSNDSQVWSSSPPLAPGVAAGLCAVFDPAFDPICQRRAPALWDATPETVAALPARCLVEGRAAKRVCLQAVGGYIQWFAKPGTDADVTELLGVCATAGEEAVWCELGLLHGAAWFFAGGDEPTGAWASPCSFATDPDSCEAADERFKSLEPQDRTDAALD